LRFTAAQAAREYRFVRRYLERNPQLPLSLRQVGSWFRLFSNASSLIFTGKGENYLFLKLFMPSETSFIARDGP
jgi:hypothetical protein